MRSGTFNYAWECAPIDMYCSYVFLVLYAQIPAEKQIGIAKTLCATKLCHSRCINNIFCKVRGRVWPPTCAFYGAPDTIRTYDTRFRRAVLYPLSYGGK